MPIEITIPRLGWNMEEGRFVAWLKRDGEMVRPGEAIFSLESEKSVEEIEALDGGILRIPPDGPKEGDVLAVGTVIGFLLQENEAIPVGVAAGSKPAEEVIRSDTTYRSYESNTSHETTLPEVQTEPRITPRARRVAKELGVTATTLQGTGRNGRIRERDVRAAAGSNSAQKVPHSVIRKTIAERMVASLRETAPVTLTTVVDATNLVALRNELKSHEPTPSYTDLFIKIVATALQTHPHLNARWEADALVLSPEAHIGIAVDTEAGLMVPVVRNAGSLTIQQITERTRSLIEKAGQRQLKAEDMQSGTFTITNLGAYGIDAFTPIINWPECAILGIGRIRKQPAVVNDQIVPRDMVSLSLTFDHRIVDGAPAARFLHDVTRLAAIPSNWME